MNSAEAMSKLPVVVILGSTATGKSKLAISLAHKFKGEIISADSMQVYKGLDILTNKIGQEKMKEIPHHMISVVDAKEKYDITCFRNQALPIVERILQNEKIAFIVGGTNYYIESLLWKILVDDTQRLISPVSNASAKRKLDHTSDDSPKEMITEVTQLFERCQGHVEDEDLLAYSSPVLYLVLNLCDPKRALHLHPNDRRKILRSLQVCYQTGKKHSDIISEQRRNVVLENSEDGTSHLGGPLRFQNLFCLWIKADKQLLNQRINSRVDKMVDKGLRLELETYIDILRENNSELDFTRGILQSIGFKEFTSYLQLPSEERRTKHGDDLFDVGKDLLKIATRQYAKRQVQWINQRFLQPRKRQVPPIYSLDGNLTDETSWDINVTQPALTILENYLNGNFEHPIFEMKRVPNVEEKADDRIARICEICDNRVVVGNLQWEAHLAGRRHKKMKKRHEIETDILSVGFPVAHSVSPNDVHLKGSSSSTQLKAQKS